MENNKENQGCQCNNCAPEEKKCGVKKIVTKIVKIGLLTVGTVVTLGYLDKKFLGGKGKAFVEKQGKTLMGKIKPAAQTESREHTKPANRIYILDETVEVRPQANNKKWDNHNNHNGQRKN